MGSEPFEERNITFEDWKGLREVHSRVAQKPLCEQIVAYMDYWHWDATDFICETGLLQRHHSEIIHGKTKSMQLENLITICIALRLTAKQAEDLLRAARLALSLSDEDEHLLYLLETKVGWSIDACNAFLRRAKQPELGSKQKPRPRT